jgi:hypothetical protein
MQIQDTSKIQMLTACSLRIANVNCRWQTAKYRSDADCRWRNADIGKWQTAICRCSLQMKKSKMQMHTADSKLQNAGSLQISAECR